MRYAVACLATFAALIAAGCGGGGDSTTAATGAASTTTASAAQSTDMIEISDFKFMPETVTVKAGAKVTWMNSDDTSHTATADDGSFDTGTLDKGDAKTVTFD